MELDRSHKATFMLKTMGLCDSVRPGCSGRRKLLALCSGSPVVDRWMFGRTADCWRETPIPSRELFGK